MKRPKKTQVLTVSQAFSLAKKMLKKGEFNAASELYTMILQKEPNNLLAKKQLRKIRENSFQRGQNPLFERNNPSNEEIGNLVTLYQSGRLDEAEKLSRSMLSVYPQSATIYNIQGAVQGALGKPRDALESYQQAISADPKFAEAFNNSGVVLKMMGKLDGAVERYKQAIRLSPAYGEAYSNLCVALQELSLLDDALLAANKAIELMPESAEAHFNRGLVLRDSRQLEASLDSYAKAIQISPRFSKALCGYGLALHELGEYSKATNYYRKAIEVDPVMAEAYANFGTLLQDMGCLEEALENYKKAVRLAPDYLSARSNLLMLLSYFPFPKPEDYFLNACEYGRIVRSAMKTYSASSKSTLAVKKLRVGFVSGDIKNHPVGYFLESVINSIDKSRFELYAYPTTSEFDSLSDRIQSCFASWKPISQVGDKEAAALISADNVNILIDLSGHTKDNRLSIFPFRPSAVQVSWLGYFATTGVKEIDYIISDPYVTPTNTAEQFVESIWRLPKTRWCYTPPKEDARISELPAAKNGFVTFGCFSNLSKLNDQVISLWGNVLQSVPNSRLVLKSYQFHDRAILDKTLKRFIALGVSDTRIDLERPEDRDLYLQAYNKIDITLDTFPFTGGTTSVDSLWMGVPLVTLRGTTLVSRQGVSILMNTGLQEWIANDEEDYLSKAVHFAANIAELARLRSGLRSKVLESPLFDAQQFAKDFEQALWEMWSVKQ